MRPQGAVEPWDGRDVDLSAEALWLAMRIIGLSEIPDICVTSENVPNAIRVARAVSASGYAPHFNIFVNDSYHKTEWSVTSAGKTAWSRGT